MKPGIGVVQALALEPMHDPEQAGGDPDASSQQPPVKCAIQPSLGINAADEFLAEAIREYEGGRIDSSVWKSVEQTTSDATLVVAAYLRARASALRLEKHPPRSESPARIADTQPQRSDRTAAAPHALRQPARALRRRLAYAIAAIVTVTIAAAILFYGAAPGSGEQVAATAAASAAQPASPTVASSGKAEPPAAAVAGADDENATLEKKVQELRAAGNWNVLVLYATEWTRKDPANPTPWYELSVGYAKLGQLGDAREAATRAVQLAPGQASLWRLLAHVDFALDRFPEAEAAFGKALAIDPADIDAVCGAAAVARKLGRAQGAPGPDGRATAHPDEACPAVGGDLIALDVGPPAAKAISSPAR